MLTTETLDNSIRLLREGFTYPSITTETGLTREAVECAYDTGASI